MMGTDDYSHHVSGGSYMMSEKMNPMMWSGLFQLRLKVNNIYKRENMLMFRRVQHFSINTEEYESEYPIDSLVNLPI